MRGGELDLIVAGLAQNEQRQAYMDFTNSYYHSRSIYLGLPNSVDISPEGLKGKRIGVQEHTQQEIFLQRHWADVVELIRFPAYEQLLEAFCAGGLDAILVDGLSGYEFLQSERGQPFAILDDPLPPDADLAYAHIGVRKGDPELVDALNEAIVHIKLNGDYDASCANISPSAFIERVHAFQAFTKRGTGKKAADRHPTFSPSSSQRP